MKNPNVTAEIRSIDPVAEYDGIVYDQEVTIQLGDVEHTIYDPSLIIEADDVGREATLVLHLFPEGDVDIIDHQEGVIMSQAEGEGGWAHTICGAIKDVDTKNRWYNDPPDRLITIDVGSGSILVSCYGDLLSSITKGDIKPGDYVCVPGTRLEVIEMVN